MKVDRNKTALAAELFVAAELTKQGHLVTITFGKEKAIDLLVAHRDEPSKTCSIDVKGLKQKNPWGLGNYKKRRHPVCYVFCLLGNDKEYPLYYIIRKEKVDTLVKADSNGNSHWVYFQDVLPYKDRWDFLWEGI